MSNDNKTMADVQPGGRVRLGDGREPMLESMWVEIRREGDRTFPRVMTKDQADAFLRTCNVGPLPTVHPLYAALSAQPSTGGQAALDCIGRIEEAIEFRVPHDIYAAVHGELAELKAALAARQPVGELHLPPDGFYKIVFDDAEVPDESFARSGALDAALRRFEQISNKWNAHLFVRFANNTRDCTAPNATPAQAVDLGRWSQRHADDLHVAVHTALSVHAGSLSQKKRAAISAYVKRLLIDSQAVGNG